MKFPYAISRTLAVVVIAGTLLLIDVWKQARTSLIHANLECTINSSLIQSDSREVTLFKI